MAGKTFLLVLFTCVLQTTNAVPEFINTANLEDVLTNLPENFQVRNILGTIECQDDSSFNGNISIQVTRLDTEIEIIKNNGASTSNLSNYFVLLKSRQDFETSIINQNDRDVSFVCRSSKTINGEFQDTVFETKMVIIDINDNKPEFVRDGSVAESYNVKMNEVIDLPVGGGGRLIFRNITVTDKDGFNNDRVEALCVDVSTVPTNLGITCDQVFEVRAVKDERARETEPAVYTFEVYALRTDYTAFQSFTLSIMAMNVPLNTNYGNTMLNSTSQNVAITILEVQNQRPVIDQNSLRLEMPENRPVGDQVDFNHFIGGYDQDLRDPNPVSFELYPSGLEQDGFNYFNLGPVIPPEVGGRIYRVQLFVKSTVDRESIIATSKSLFVNIRAFETNLNNLPNRNPMNTTAIITVVVQDENDDIPSFLSASYNITINELTGTSTSENRTQLVPFGGAITVTDNDGLDFNSYNLTILPNRYSDLFSLNRYEGSGNTIFTLYVDNSALDYELGNNLMTVTLHARDLANTDYTSTTLVTLTINNRNDFRPRFLEGAYNFTIDETRPEDIPVNIFVGKVSAVDGDAGASGEIANYTITSNLFRIDENGNIFLIASVDYETTKLYRFSVTAMDSDPENPQDISVRVSVTVNNIIDAPPNILGEYVTTVLETSTELRPSITVKAENIEELTTITYSLEGVEPPMANFDQYFMINPISGEFTLIKSLNYRNTNAGLIRVLVRATATQQLFSERYINITVENQNNDPPVFVPSRTDNIYTVTVSELATPGTTVIDLNTTDADEPDTKASEVFFEIRSGGNNNFLIEENSGIIRVAQGANIDADQQEFYTIVVKARDNGSPILSASATVRVQVENKNDKPPVFERPLYQFRVNATAASQTIIGQVIASDIDLNPRIVYGFDYISAEFQEGSQKIPEYVDIEPLISIEEISGIIRLTGTLNRDLYDRIIINATAKDLAAEAGSPSQITSASVVINVIAQADPTIQFDAPWSVARPIIEKTYQENDRLTDDGIFKLQAFDPLTSGAITFFRKVQSSDPGDYFQVVESNIVLKKPLDYEKLPLGDNNLKIVSVIVEALSNDVDLPRRTSTATIRFQVNDVNDNKPQFTKNEYVETVKENAAYPSIVATISVTDADSSSYGLAQFSLEGETEKNFFIRPSESQANQAFILVAEDANLDYETNPTFNILVVATDNNGAPDGQRTFINMRINLEDVNDEAPKFRNDRYQFNVIGTAEDGHTVGRILADDLDKGDGGVIFYTLVDSNDNTDLPFFKAELERESTATVGNVLQICRITVARSLESLIEGASFTLIATATDRGTPSLSSTTIVEITVSRGVVDPKPKWAKTNPSRVKIPENRPANYPVASIKANPGNSYNSTASIIYSLVTPSDTDGDTEKFNINRNTGEIRTSQPLDYEDAKFYNAEGSVIATFKLLILATDSTNSTLTNQFLLIVELLDEDDNDPTFQNCKDKTFNIPEYATVMESLTPGQFVYQVVACDDDEAPNNDVAYRPFTPILQDSNLCPDQGYLLDSTFELDQYTGVITTGRLLDREVKSSYLLCVEAIKMGDLRRKRGVTDFTRATELHYVLFLNIQVLDANDNGPVFKKKLIEKAILSYPSGFISSAEATDIDIAPNNQIRYIIEEIKFYKGKKGKYRAPAAFTIDAKDGIIYPGQASYEDYVGGYFSIRIKAQDRNGNNNLDDTQIQKVYVTQKVNRIRVVINRPADGAVAEDVTEMIGKLNNLQEGIFYEVDKISYHVVGSQENLLSDKTDVCILVVRDDSVLTARDATIFLEGQASVQNILQEYGAAEPGTCDPAKSVYPQGWKSYWWVLVAFAIFIFLCVLILIFIILSLYSGYKRYMDTRRTYLVPGN